MDALELKKQVRELKAMGYNYAQVAQIMSQRGVTMHQPRAVYYGRPAPGEAICRFCLQPLQPRPKDLLITPKQ